MERAAREDRGGLELVFKALVTPAHRALVEAVAAAGACSSQELLSLDARKPILSQRLSRLRRAGLIQDDGRRGAPRYRIGPKLQAAWNWFEYLGLNDDLCEIAREHIDIQLLFDGLSMYDNRRALKVLSTKKAMSNSELAAELKLTPAAASKCARSLKEAGLILRTRQHPYVRLTLDQLALWRAWDWFELCERA